MSILLSLSPTEVGMLSGGFFPRFLLHLHYGGGKGGRMCSVQRSGGGGGKGERMCSVQRYRWLCSLPSAGGLTLENWEGWQSLGGGLHVLHVIPVGFWIE